ncbi:MAG: isoquinoline 1-oxidoreductase alpha subunit [Cyclobacteriaceae bacterium]
MALNPNEMANYEININGENTNIENVPEDMPLLWVLRDIVGFRGTKFGCGQGLCGACTVHFEGNAVRSCSLPIAAANGKKITTIEGLSENGDHPLQQAWVKKNVPQCGYCQAGQIMNAAALLKNNPNPTEDEIVNGMHGNICRCGTYIRIKEAIQLAAKSGGVG